VTYGYSFTTASTATLSSLTMSLPMGTLGSPVLGGYSGLPGSGPCRSPRPRRRSRTRSRQRS
jgi:hypothetical protein